MAYISYKDKIGSNGELSDTKKSISIRCFSEIETVAIKSVPSGDSYFAGKLPDGLTTISGEPTSATVLCVVRNSTKYPHLNGVIVKKVESNLDGTWLIPDVDPTLTYDIIGRKTGYNDIIVANVTPIQDSWTYSEYEEWALNQSYIYSIKTWLSVNNTNIGTSQLTGQSGNYIYTIDTSDDPLAGTMTMYGSPASSNQRVTSDSKINATLLHCVQNVNSIGSGGHKNVVIFNVMNSNGDGSEYLSVNKNGYTSLSYLISYTGCSYVSCTYWDVALGKPRVYNCVTNSYSDLYK